MLFDTHPGDTPLPLLNHTLPNCACGHSDDLHEEVETGSKPLVICIECDADDDDELPI